MAPVMANPKDVAQIAAIMEHLSVYHIATALDEANYNKRNAVLSLLAGKPPSPEVSGYLELISSGNLGYQSDSLGYHGPVIVGQG